MLKLLEELYEKKRESSLELAKKYKCSQWTIYNNLKKYKIKVRKCGDFHKWKSPGNQFKPNIGHSGNISYMLGVLLGEGWVHSYKNNYFIGLDSIDYAFKNHFQRR